MIEALTVLTIYHLLGIKKTFVVVGVLLGFCVLSGSFEPKDNVSSELIGFLITVAIYYFVAWIKDDF